MIWVVAVFLMNLDSIRDKMIENLKKLITIIRNQNEHNFVKKIEIEDVSCDDEVFEIVSVLNMRSEQIEQYINHLKYVIGYIQHEFNTPLATLALWIERLKKKYPEVDVGSLEEEVHDLSKIMNSLSYLSSQEAKNITFTELQPLSVVTKAVDLLSVTYSDANIQYFGDSDMVVHSSEIYLHIIIKNIIENALKYSGDEKKVDVYFYADWSRIQIRDYGQWMSPEDIKKIGLPFWQWDESRGKNGGFWLWLTLVYELAELLWVQIQVSSQKGVWSTFTLLFTTPTPSNADA